MNFRKTFFPVIAMLVVSGWVLLTAVFLSAQPPTPKALGKENDPTHQTIRLETTLVTLPVSVLDKQGRCIQDLRAEDFRVYEDKVEQEIVYFDSYEKPFTVALLLDVSDSAKLKLSDIQASAINFIEQLKPADRLLILTFDKQVTLLTDTTDNHEAAKLAIKQIRDGGGTSLYDAVEVVVQRYLNRIAERKAMVLFTDGVDTTSVGTTYERSLRSMAEFDGLLYAIQYNTLDDPKNNLSASSLESGMATRNHTTPKGESLTVAYERGTRYLRLLSDHTGGRFFYADTPKNLSASFARIAGELGQQYSLSYYPSNLSQEKRNRQIKVQVRRQNVVVRTRKQYIYNPANKLPAK